MAIAEKVLAAQFNRDGHEVIDHYTYVFAGDGCLMEGISHEVCSLAGTLGLGKLIAFYDDNGISIDGEVEGWFTDDTPVIVPSVTPLCHLNKATPISSPLPPSVSKSFLPPPPPPLPASFQPSFP